MTTRAAVRTLYLPTMALAGAAVVWAASQQRWMLVVAAVVAGLAWNRVAERIAPYDDHWNHDRGDRSRDFAHAATNEALTLVGLLAAPSVVDLIAWRSLWPSNLPFGVEVALAVVVADAGITAAHYASHRVAGLWRLHAVHHSVTRMYGFNGLMKHPLHQTVETLAGVSPLLLLGMPTPVAVALTGLVVLQLNIQHSNTTYSAAGLHRWCAFNQGHRLHHRNRIPDGDVNFGLFLLVWDHLLGTYDPASSAEVHDGDIGLAGVAVYPTTWSAQLIEPFKQRRPQSST